jgi:hypothetical protein
MLELGPRPEEFRALPGQPGNRARVLSVEKEPRALGLVVELSARGLRTEPHRVRSESW